MVMEDVKRQETYIVTMGIHYRYASEGLLQYWHYRINNFNISLDDTGRYQGGRGQEEP